MLELDTVGKLVSLKKVKVSFVDAVIEVVEHHFFDLLSPGGIPVRRGCLLFALYRATVTCYHLHGIKC